MLYTHRMQKQSVAARLLYEGGPSRAERVHSILRLEIIEGTLPPGTRLSELAIADELGVSRTPVREALRLLEQEGLVVRQRGHGLFVAELTRKEAAEIIGMRSVLEGYAAGLAADRITPLELEKIRLAHKDAEEAIALGDVSRLVKANTTFHDTINEASHAPRCVAMIAELRDWVLRYRAEALADEEARRRSFEQHAEILTALEEGDAQKTEQLMRVHILDTTGSVVERIATSSEERRGGWLSR